MPAGSLRVRGVFAAWSGNRLAGRPASRFAVPSTRWPAGPFDAEPLELEPQTLAADAQAAGGAREVPCLGLERLDDRPAFLAAEAVGERRGPGGRLGARRRGGWDRGRSRGSGVSRRRPRT